MQLCGLRNGAIPICIPALSTKVFGRYWEASVEQLSQGYQSPIVTAENPSRVFALDVETY